VAVRIVRGLVRNGVAIYAVPSEFPFVALRWVLGSVFVLFIPGYVTVEALFPKAVS